jgi:hypothetical protein
MKRIQIIMLNTILICAFSCKSQQNELGLEIYLQNIPHPILTNENPEECYCCVEILKENLSSQPLISKNDIEHFDWEKQKISLTDSGTKKISELNFSKHGVYGITTAIVLNGDPIYSFLIFPIGSSIACDRPFTHLNYEKKDMYIHFGVGKGKNELKYGEDPRFNSELKEYIEKHYGNN